jgi:hypothetical protein
MRNGNDIDNDTTTTTTTTTREDPSVLWERLQESQRQRVELMKEEKEKLQNEIDTMNSVLAKSSDNVSDDDIIEIDAGGKIIKALRSTLCLVAPDTMFSYTFSGRWEDTLIRDDRGRVFLDHDPELIELIVNFLRTKKIENQSSKTIKSSKIPDGKKDEFESLLHYFGLTDFFYPPPVFFPLDIGDVVHPNGYLVDLTKSENKIHFSKVNGKGHCFVACKPYLDTSGEGSFWKVTIDVLPNHHWVYLGIIGNLDATDKSFQDSTSYGWSCGSGVWIEGSKLSGSGGWTQFTEGERLYFHLKFNKLIMFSVQKNKRFVIDIARSKIVREYYIHFNLYDPGNKILLEPLNEDERECLLLEN